MDSGQHYFLSTIDLSTNRQDYFQSISLWPTRLLLSIPSQFLRCVRNQMFPMCNSREAIRAMAAIKERIMVGIEPAIGFWNCSTGARHCRASTNIIGNFENAMEMIGNND
jgi:hypothetical protein